MRKSWLTILAAAILPIAAYSQIGGPPPDAIGGPPHDVMFGPGPGGPGMFMHPGKVVKGAPYSATATRHFSQTLAGGNTIQRTTTSQVARDNEGRTYAQESIADGPLMEESGSKTVVFINDPVAGYSYVLHPDEKIAIRRAIRTPRAESDAHDPHTKDGASMRHGQEVNATDLGSKEIPGAGAVQGKSITHTIPAGKIGNAQPIVSTSEVWHSPELQVVVSAKHNDPRMGQSTYALSNIQRGEPNASLFQVPSDYTIKDAAERGRHGRPE